jgi:hypothetical protein
MIAILNFLSILNFLCAGYLFGTVIFHNREMKLLTIIVFLVIGLVNLLVGCM